MCPIVDTCRNSAKASLAGLRIESNVRHHRSATTVAAGAEPMTSVLRVRSLFDFSLRLAAFQLARRTSTVARGDLSHRIREPRGLMIRQWRVSLPEYAVPSAEAALFVPASRLLFSSSPLPSPPAPPPLSLPHVSNSVDRHSVRISSEASAYLISLKIASLPAPAFSACGGISAEVANRR